MTLDEIIKVVDTLSLEELRQLSAHIQQIQARPHPARGRTPEERIRLLREAAEEIRAGMTQAELDEMTAAMNAEYIEPFNDEMWKE